MGFFDHDPYWDGNEKVETQTGGKASKGCRRIVA